MKQKILLLCGSNGQIPAIEEAKRRVLYTILCDYLPDNPGRDLVDKFYLVSTTDKEKVIPMNYPGSNVGVLILTFESSDAVQNKNDLFQKLNMGLSIQELNRK